MINFDPSDPYYLSLWVPDKVTAYEKTAEASQQQDQPRACIALDKD